MLKNSIYRYLPIILICILGAIPPLIWFKEGLIIAGGDSYYYLDPSTNFKDYIYAWLTKMESGVPNQSVSQVFPFMFFWVVLKWVGLSLVNIERLWAILIFVTPGLSIYYLVVHLSNEKNNKLAGFIAAVLYMFNVFVMMDVLQPNFRLVQAALPVTLLFWIKGLNNRKFSLKYPVLIGIISIFYASSNINIPVVSIIPITLFIYFLFFSLIQKHRIFHALQVIIATAVIYILVNFWWISTSFRYMTEISSSVQQAANGVSFTGSTTILEAFRLMGFWAFLGYFTPDLPTMPYAYIYYKPVLLTLTYLIPIMVFFVLLKDSKRNHIHFFAILAIVGLFLTKGVNEPFGFIYKFFYENVPGFWIFREPFSKFTPITLLSYSVLLGYSVEEIYRRMNGWTSLKKNHPVITPAFVPILVMLIMLIAAFPIITGKAIQDSSWYHDSKFSLKVDVPKYWYDIGKWLKQNDMDDRVLVIPKAGYGHAYNWKSGMASAGPVAMVFLHNPLISYPSAQISDSAKLIGRLYDFINPDATTNIAPFLGLFNVKYVLQQNDLDWKYGLLFNSYSPEMMKGFLDAQPGIVFKKSFGSLDLYEVKEEYFLPHIYVPDVVNYASGNDSVVDIVSSSGFEVKNAIFNVENLNGEQKQTVIKDANNIFVKVSPTNSSEKGLEYDFVVPKDSVYKFYLKAPDDMEYDSKNVSLWLDGKRVDLQSVVEDEMPSEYKLWHYEFKELLPCDECNNKIKANFKFYIPITARKYDQKKDAVYLNNVSVANINSVFVDVISWKDGDESSIDIGFPLENISASRSSLTFGDEWKLITDDGNVALYQTFLPDSFPLSLDTSPSKKELIMVYRNGVLLKKGGFGFPLKEPDSISIGEILPRRVAVSVPSGTKPTGNYSIVYLKEAPSIPSAKYSIKYREQTEQFLTNLNLSKGRHNIKLHLPILYKNEAIQNNITMKYRFKGLILCAKCDDKIKLGYVLEPQQEIVPDTAKNGFLLGDKRIYSLSLDNSTDIALPIVNISSKSLTFGDEWKFIMDDGNVALYQTFLPDSFPLSLDTSPSKKELIMVYRDGVLLKKGGFGFPLKELDSISIGEILPRRVAVSVRSGTKPIGNYSIEYINETPFLPPAEYSIRYNEQTDQFFLFIIFTVTPGYHLTFSSPLIAKADNIKNKTNIILRADNPVQASKPLIKYSKINPAEYNIHITGATAPYYLVFSESYNPKWKAHIGSDEISEKNHLVVNGYANAWYIDRIGDYQITLEYLPQRLLKAGLIISGITLTLGIIYLLRKSRFSINEEIESNIDFSRQNSFEIKLFQKPIQVRTISKIFIILFMALLLIAVISIASKQRDMAETLGVWAYISLSIGILLQLD